MLWSFWNVTMHSLLYSHRETNSQVSQRVFKLENTSEVSGCFSLTFLFPLCPPSSSEGPLQCSPPCHHASLNSLIVTLRLIPGEGTTASNGLMEISMIIMFIFSPKFDLKGIKILLGRDYIYLLGPLRYKCSTWSQCRRWLHPQN